MSTEDNVYLNQSKDGKDSVGKIKEKAVKATIFAEENDDFYKKWAGPVIIGPFIPFLFSLIVIVSGQIVVHYYNGTCSYPLPEFIGACVGISYIFVMIYSWIFIGDTVWLKISLLNLNYSILAPFRSLKWLMVIYAILFLTSFIIWSIGSALLTSASFCMTTSPGLYSYTVFLIASYWIFFIIIVIYIFKLNCGDMVAAAIQNQTRLPTIQELEERVFRKTFNELDKGKNKRIKNQDFPTLLEKLGLYIPEEGIPKLIEQLDPTSSGEMSFDDCYEWFKKMNSIASEVEKNGLKTA